MDLQVGSDCKLCLCRLRMQAEQALTVEAQAKKQAGKTRFETLVACLQKHIPLNSAAGSSLDQLHSRFVL